MGLFPDCQRRFASESHAMILNLIRPQYQTPEGLTWYTPIAVDPIGVSLFADVCMCNNWHGLFGRYAVFFDELFQLLTQRRIGHYLGDIRLHFFPGFKGGPVADDFFHFLLKRLIFTNLTERLS